MKIKISSRPDYFGFKVGQSIMYGKHRCKIISVYMDIHWRKWCKKDSALRDFAHDGILIDYQSLGGRGWHISLENALQIRKDENKNKI